MITDYEFCDRISIELGEYYKYAIDFIQLDPKSSLSKFRGIAELLCIQIGQAQNLEYPNNELMAQINELFDCQLINNVQKEDLHVLRQLGNEAVHYNRAPLRHDVNKEVARDMIKQEKERLTKEAVKARKLTVELLRDLHPLIIKEAIEDEVKIAELVDDSWKMDLVNHSISTNYKDKLKAGHIYTQLATDLAMEDMYEQGVAFLDVQEELFNHAALSYQTACFLTINTAVTEIVLKTFPTNITKEIDPDATKFDVLPTHADPECLYYLWKVHNGDATINKDLYIDTGSLLEASAKKGFSKAMGMHGKLILEKNGDKNEAREWLLKGAEHDDDVALLGLYVCDLEDLTEHDLNNAVENYVAGKKVEFGNSFDYLFKGVALGGGACLAALGMLLHDYNFDKSLSEDLLLRSIKTGEMIAYDYYFGEFKGILTPEEKVKKSLVDAFSFVNKHIRSLNESENRKNLFHKKNVFMPEIMPSLGRNDQCYCGSGKKYKKCCMS